MKPEIWIAGTSLIVSICAFWLSWRSETRGQISTRTALFLSLRTRFLEVHKGLPSNFRDPDWQASNREERAAATRYWHHAFDEWYVTKHLNEKLMHQLWDHFYSKAILDGLQCNGLRKALIEMDKRNIEPAILWREFYQEVDNIWATGHPDNGKECKGIQCSHDSP